MMIIFFFRWIVQVLIKLQNFTVKFNILVTIKKSREVTKPFFIILF